MEVRFLGLLFFVLLSAANLWGCGCSEGDTTSAFGPDCGEVIPGASGTADGSGMLIFSDQAAKSIRRFNGVSTLNSSVVTDLPLSGASTRLTRPGFLYEDPASKQLVVCDPGSSAVLFFDNPQTVVGNVAPARVLSGGNTRLIAPTQAYIWGSKNELWVLDKGANSILIYADSANIDADVAPIRKIGGASSGIQNPVAFIVQPEQGRLTVINPSEVLTFNNIESLNGDPAPMGRVSGAATTFSNLGYGLFDASNGLILVDGSTKSILYFENFNPEDNNVAPTRTVSGGNTGIAGPGQFVVTADGAMYLANGQNVLYFKTVSSLSGDVYPDRKFSALDPLSQSIRGLLLR